MKRTELKRGKPLQRGISELVRTPLARQSKRMGVRRRLQAQTKTGGPCQLRTYVWWAAFAALAEKHPDGPRLMAAFRRCTGQGSTRHHRRKAIEGGSDRGENLMLGCFSCNQAVEDLAGRMRVTSEHLHDSRGMPRCVVREGDPEYADLGRKADPR
jgi:hypothetical protein